MDVYTYAALKKIMEGSLIYDDTEIRASIDDLNQKLNFLNDSEDLNLDQLSEIVTFMKENKELIENLDTNKVNKNDILFTFDENSENLSTSKAIGDWIKTYVDNSIVNGEW